MFLGNNCTSFHLWLKENLIRHQKVLKYYENDCRSNNRAKFRNKFKICKTVFKSANDDKLKKRIWKTK